MRWRPYGPLNKTIFIHDTSHELDFIDISSKLCAIRIKTTHPHISTHCTYIELKAKSSSTNVQSFHT
jgi:hypothetical protein